jgi:hypothetical protein
MMLDYELEEDMGSSKSIIRKVNYMHQIHCSSLFCLMSFFCCYFQVWCHSESSEDLLQ